jgi:hypothetical protein
VSARFSRSIVDVVVTNKQRAKIQKIFILKSMKAFSSNNFAKLRLKITGDSFYTAIVTVIVNEKIET